MASCTTPTFGNASTCPRVTLEVNISSNTATTTTLSWVLKYYARSAAQTSVSKKYTAVIAGATVASGNYSIDGKTGTHTIASGTKVITKGTSAQTISFSCSMGFNLTWSGTYGGTKSASGSISVAAKDKYTISYNANGGSGAPGSQTKWAGTNITLSSSKPTRTGYTFAGWATSASGSVSYQPGATYSSNASVTLYAKWNAITYTVSYNANGGSGAPGNQTKTYGVNLTLSSTKPTRTNYNFKGWGTSAGTTTVSYSAGGTYSSNASITLYAIWELAYTAPRITGFSADRCNSDGTAAESGTYAKVVFSWATDKAVSSIKIEYKQETASTWNAVTVTASGTSGSVNKVIGGSLSTEYSYNIRVTVADSLGSSNATRTVGGMTYTLDLLAGGRGIAFGKPATKARTVDSAWDFCGAWGTEGDNRSVATKPSDYSYNARFMGLKSQSAIDLSDGSTHAYLMGLKGWGDKSGGVAHELAFHNKGIHHRVGVDDTSWDAWGRIVESRFIPVGTDLNTITVPGIYYGTSGSYSNVPAARYASSFTLEVYPSGDAGQIVQRLTRCHKSESMAFERVYYEGAFGSWAAIYGKTKILWSGGYYMTAGHTATLSQRISEQRSGVFVVFSPYMDAAIKNYDRNAFFVPKEVVTRHNGASMMFTSTASMPGNIVANKCLSIYDDRLVGHEQNAYVGNVSGSNIYIQNNKFVLQYVIGV